MATILEKLQKKYPNAKGINESITLYAIWADAE